MDGVWLVAGNETFEKLGTLGTSANLLVYLTQVFHMQSVEAVTLLNGLNGTSSLAPIIGAFLSDAYLGRYLALAIATVASLIVSPHFCPQLLASRSSALVSIPRARIRPALASFWNWGEIELGGGTLLLCPVPRFPFSGFRFGSPVRWDCSSGWIHGWELAAYSRPPGPRLSSHHPFCFAGDCVGGSSGTWVMGGSNRVRSSFFFFFLHTADA